MKGWNKVTAGWYEHTNNKGETASIVRTYNERYRDTQWYLTYYGERTADDVFATLREAIAAFGPVTS